MSELNQRHPNILQGYLSGNGYLIPFDECNELSKFVSGLETRLKSKEIVIESRDSAITRQSEKLLALGETLNEIAMLVLSVWPKDSNLTYVDEAQGVRVVIEEFERQRKIQAGIEREQEFLLEQLCAAIKGIFANPQGCPMCDAGVLRNPNKPHWPDCPYLIASDVIDDVDGVK